MTVALEYLFGYITKWRVIIFIIYSKTKNTENKSISVTLYLHSFKALKQLVFGNVNYKYDHFEVASWNMNLAYQRNLIYHFTQSILLKTIHLVYIWPHAYGMSVWKKMANRGSVDDTTDRQKCWFFFFLSDASFNIQI